MVVSKLGATHRNNNSITTALAFKPTTMCEVILLLLGSKHRSCENNIPTTTSFALWEVLEAVHLLREVLQHQQEITQNAFLIICHALSSCRSLCLEEWQNQDHYLPGLICRQVLPWQTELWVDNKEDDFHAVSAVP